jgi:hypothetical protein
MVRDFHILPNSFSILKILDDIAIFLGPLQVEFLVSLPRDCSPFLNFRFESNWQISFLMTYSKLDDQIQL